MVFKNQRGIALIVALILSLVSLMLVGMALYVVTQGIRLSGRLRIYATSLSAARGAYEITTSVLPSIKDNQSFDLSKINSLEDSKEKCLHIKLNYLTQDWTSTTAWGTDNCYSLNEATSSNIGDIEKFYDLKYKLGNYYVYIKIISSSLGNTQLPSNNLSSGGVSSSGSSNNRQSPPMPHLYRIEILSENSKNSNDQVHITALYAY